MKQMIFKIVSGYFNGYTTGTPLCLIIENKSQMSRDYERTKSIMRPSHADYTADVKYMGYQDYRGGGHFFWKNNSTSGSSRGNIHSDT